MLFVPQCSHFFYPAFSSFPFKKNIKMLSQQKWKQEEVPATVTATATVEENRNK